MSARQAQRLEQHQQPIARRQPVTQLGAVAPVVEVEDFERRAPVDEPGRPCRLDRVEVPGSGIVDRQHDVGPPGQGVSCQGMLDARDADRRTGPARNARDVENDPIAATHYAKRLSILPITAPWFRFVETSSVRRTSPSWTPGSANVRLCGSDGREQPLLGEVMQPDFFDGPDQDGACGELKLDQPDALIDIEIRQACQLCCGLAAHRPHDAVAFCQKQLREAGAILTRDPP
jgi:hypothetical protein